MSTVTRRLLERRDRSIALASSAARSAGGAALDNELLSGAIDDLADVDRRLSIISRIREPLTYQREGGPSYFVDLLNQASDDQAAARLARHAIEADVELAERRRRADRDFRSELGQRGGSFERRTNPNRTAGTGGNFAPPLWMVDMFATAPIAGRVLGGIVPSIPLPVGFQSISIPRLVVNPPTATLTDGGTVTGADPTDAAAVSTVATIAGAVVASMQLLEQSGAPGFDVLMGRALLESYGGTLERQLLVGAGTGADLLGLSNVVGIASVTYTDASPTPAECYVPILQALAAVGDNRLRPPTAVLMAPRRWFWLSSPTTFTDGLLENPPGRGHMTDPDELEAGGPIGPIAGVPTYLDGGMPLTLNTNQDPIIVTRPADHLLFESEPVFQVATEPLSGTLQARIILRRYAAWFGGLRPTATSIITGTGLAGPSGY
jgi:hypothetical protein